MKSIKEYIHYKIRTQYPQCIIPLWNRFDKATKMNTNTNKKSITITTTTIVAVINEAEGTAIIPMTAEEERNNSKTNYYVELMTGII